MCKSQCTRNAEEDADAESHSDRHGNAHAISPEAEDGDADKAAYAYEEARKYANAHEYDNEHEYGDAAGCEEQIHVI